MLLYLFRFVADMGSSGLRVGGAMTRRSSMRPAFSAEEIMSLFRYYIWSSKRRAVKEAFRDAGPRTTLRLIGKGYLGGTNEMRFDAATSDILPMIDAKLSGAVTLEQEHDAANEQRRLLQPYFATEPYGLFSVTLAPGEVGGVVVSSTESR